MRFAGTLDRGMGGKLPGLGGAVPGTRPGVAAGCADGTSNAWSGRGMWTKPGTAGVGRWIGYMYNKYKVSDCGDNVPTNRAFTANKWHKVKQYYKMNTIGTDGTVNADGVHKRWFDGVLIVDKNNFRYRDNSNLHITHIFWAIFRGGSTMDWASSTPGPIDIDNLIIESPGLD